MRHGFHHVRRSRYTLFAVLLVIGYLLTMIMQFMLLEAVKLGNDNWLIQEKNDFSQADIIIYFLSLLFSILPGIGLLFLFARNVQERLSYDHDAPGLRDVIYYFAWYQVGYAIFQVIYMLVSWPFFSTGSVGAIIEGTIMHMWMITIFILLFYPRKKWFGFIAPRRAGRLFFMVLLVFVGLNYTIDPLVTYPVADFFNIEIQSWREDGILKEIMTAKQYGMFNVILLIVSIGIVVPIAEEIMFRGVLQTALVQRFGVKAGIIMASLIFAVIHIDPALMAPLFVMGLVMGLFRHVYGSIWASILFHAVNNSYAVIAGVIIS